MKTIKILHSVLIASLALASCHKNDVSRSQNEQEKAVVTAANDIAPTASEKDLNALNLTQIADDSLHQKDPKALLALVNQLAEFVLNKNYVEDPAFRLGDKMRTLLSDFNQGYLRLYAIDPEALETKKILSQYMTVAFSGCESTSLKNCKNTDFFRLDFRSIDILILRANVLDFEIIDIEKSQQCNAVCFQDITEYYRILGLVSDEKNQEKQTQIEFLYLKHARDYANYLTSQLPAGQPIVQSIREQLSAHASYFESLISKFKADPKSPGFKDFVSNFKPWSYSRLEPDLFPYGAEKMFSYAAQNYLYVENEKGSRSLNPDLLRAIADSQVSGKVDIGGQNFSDSVKSINANNPQLLKTFGVDASLVDSESFLNEYFFIIDRLYRGHINSEEAREIWLGSSQDKMKLLSMLEYYIKIQVLILVDKSNQLFRSIYSQKTQQSGLMIKVLNDSSQISFSWDKMISQIDQMNIFISNLFEKNANDPDFLHSSVLLKSVKSNIKYVSVYPNMLVLSYFMSSLNEDILNPRPTNQNDMHLRPDEIVVQFFDGKQNPWFEFGNDVMFGISKVGIIFSYHFANMTGTIEGYNPKVMSDSTLSFTQKNLFEKVTTKYLLVEKLNLESAINELRTSFDSNANFGEAIRVCGSLSFDKSETKITSNTFVNRNIEDLDQYASVGSSSTGLTGTFQEFYRVNASDDKVADAVRSSFDRKLVRVQAMVKILEQDIDFIHATAEEKSELVKAVEAQVNSLESLKTQYFRMAFALHRKISSCEILMSRLERQNQYEIFKAEADYLSRVYDVYAAVDSSPQTAKQALDKANLDFKLNVPDAKDLDFFTDLGYRYSKYGLLLRISENLANLTPKVIVRKIADPKTLSYWGSSQILSFRGSDGKLMKKEDYVANAMKRLNGLGDTYLNWTQGFSIVPKKRKILGMTALYKLGYYLGETDRISADEVISEVFDLIQSINITSADLPILNWLGLSNKLGIASVGRSLDDLEDVSKKNDIKASFLDAAFMQVSTDKLSQSDFQEQSGPLDVNVFNNILDDAVNLYATLKSFEEFLLPPDKDQRIKSVMMKLYQPKVIKTLGMVKEFRDAIQKVENKETAKEIKYLFDLNERGAYSVDFSQSGPIYVSRNKLKAYDDSIYDFTEPKTHHCFDTPDCVGSAKSGTQK